MKAEVDADGNDAYKSPGLQESRKRKRYNSYQMNFQESLNHGRQHAMLNTSSLEEDIDVWRQRFYTLDEPITLTAEQHEGTCFVHRQSLHNGHHKNHILGILIHIYSRKSPSDL